MCRHLVKHMPTATTVPPDLSEDEAAQAVQHFGAGICSEALAR
jgi:hypothetical protein